MDRLIALVDALRADVLRIALPLLALFLVYELIALAWPRLPRFSGVLGIFMIAVGLLVLPDMLAYIFTL